MTRRFDGLVRCPYCKAEHTAESDFERWIRNHEGLHSGIEGLVRFDCDILLHRYLRKIDKRGCRDIQCLMFIEGKTHGADVSASQHDTLSLFSQVLRNRKSNRHQPKRGRHASEHSPLCRVYSQQIKRSVSLWMFGGHLLQLENCTPEDSAWMMWDRKGIDVETLLGLLRFDLDPDSLKTIDWRRRYSDFNSRKAQRLLIQTD